jgi:hypothetical protein
VFRDPDFHSLVKQTRNAAAKCRIWLSGGFVCVNQLDDAERLCSDAFQLVQNDSALEREMKALQDQIRTACSTS